MEFTFHNLHFHVTEDNRVVLKKHHLYDCSDNLPMLDTFLSIEFAGGPSTGTQYNTDASGSEALRLQSYDITDQTLTITQASDRLIVTSVFEGYSDTNAIHLHHQIQNISSDDICLEYANTLSLRFAKDPLNEKRDWYLHRFTNTRYAESLPIVSDFYHLGITSAYSLYRDYNVGVRSSSDCIPQAILENRKTGHFFMFQIESFSDWYYEISMNRGMYYLHIGGPNQYFQAWNKILKPGGTYSTTPVMFCSGNSLNHVLAEMTRGRRHLVKYNEADKNLPVIFNEYMHLSWDDPFTDRTEFLAPFMVKAGCDYYVVDCGWHSDVTPDQVYRNFGSWWESKRRFPEGLRSTAEYVRSLGMKFGVWIAPEVVGIDNQEMLSYYGDECFLYRNGKKIQSDTGYLLDYRHPKVIESMTAAFDRMVNEYGIDYIKYDGTPYMHIGTDTNCTSLGDGLEEHINAFLSWTRDMMDRYPHVIFEDCCGGGQRLDYKALSMFQLASTSDQTDYAKYPYIVGNIFCSVLPEQAGVWTYPVADSVYDADNETATNDKVSKELVVLNMLNSMLGRIHMASRIYLLDEEKQALIHEGVNVYNRMTPDKLQAVPYLPKGYTDIDDTFVAVGLKTDTKVYLGVWNLNGERSKTLKLPEITVKDVTVAYPQTLATDYTFASDSITIHFTEDEQARLFEITLDESCR